MKIKAIKQGDTLKLHQELEIPDGTEIEIYINENEVFKNEERQKKLEKFLNCLPENVEDLVSTLTMLEAEKRANWEKLYGSKQSN
jgi:predicted DNA-binding antitoxin AbrB/MazE fold protein